MEPLRTTGGTVSVRASRGVTLIELLVVVSIIGIITVVVVISKSKFDNTLLLTNAAYDVALTLESAKTFGLGNRVTNQLPSDVRNAGYGIHFVRNTSTFLLFADTQIEEGLTDRCRPLRAGGSGSDPDAVPGDCVYYSGSDVSVTPYTLGNGATITGLHWYNAAGTKFSPTQLDITFARPNTQAFFGAGGSHASDAVRACIVLAARQGGQSYVHVQKTGSIVVNSTPC